MRVPALPSDFKYHEPSAVIPQCNVSTPSHPLPPFDDLTCRRDRIRVMRPEEPADERSSKRERRKEGGRISVLIQLQTLDRSLRLAYHVRSSRTDWTYTDLGLWYVICPSLSPCKQHCITLGIDCKYLYQPKKRGQSSILHHDLFVCCVFFLLFLLMKRPDLLNLYADETSARLLGSFPVCFVLGQHVPIIQGQPISISSKLIISPRIRL